MTANDLFMPLVFVWNREGTEKGEVRGQRMCRMESCGHYRVAVRWPDGKLTWPCEAAILRIAPSEGRIQ